jgi:hypothetical protein
MCKIKILIGLAILGLIFYSCGKEQVSLNENVELKSAPYWVENGVLNFSTGEAYEKLNDELSKMSFDEAVQWEKSIGFKSYRTEYYAFLDKLDSITTKDDYSKLLNTNKDIVVEKDGVIEPIIEQTSYQRTINRNGFFIVNGILQKATKSELLIYDDFCGNSQKEMINLTSNSWTRKVELTEGVKLKSTYCGNSENETSETVDGKWCFAEYKVKIASYAGNGSDVLRCYEVNCISYARKHNLFGVTVNYSSIHACSDLEFVISAPKINCNCNCVQYSDTTISYSGGVTSTTMNTKAWFSGLRVGSYITNIVLIEPEFKRVKGTFWTSGTTNPNPPYNHVNAVINCGYGYN